MYPIQNTPIPDEAAYEETATLYRYIAEIDERLRPLGLTADVDGDLRGWRELICEKAPRFGVTRALDPDYNDLRPGNSYWIKILDDTGEPVACQADRICPSRHFVKEWLWTNRLYGDKAPPRQWRPMPLPMKNLPILSGTVIYGGGTWVDPKFRATNVFSDVSLGGIASRLGRLHGAAFFSADNFSATIVAGRKFGQLCGLQNSATFTRGYYTGRGADLDVDFWWMSRPEIVAQASEELDVLERLPAKYAVSEPIELAVA